MLGQNNNLEDRLIGKIPKKPKICVFCQGCMRCSEIGEEPVDYPL